MTSIVKDSLGQAVTALRDIGTNSYIPVWRTDGGRGKPPLVMTDAAADRFVAHINSDAHVSGFTAHRISRKGESA